MVPGARLRTIMPDPMSAMICVHRDPTMNCVISVIGINAWNSLNDPQL